MEYLVVTAVGPDRPGIVADLTGAVAARGASVADSRMALLGGEFALIMLVADPAADSRDIGAALTQVAGDLGLQVIVRPTERPEARRRGNVRSYEVKVHALDHPGIVHAVTAALREAGGNVVSVETAAYQAAVTGAPLFRMELTADFPPEVTASSLRVALAAVSEAAHADVDVEPL